MKGLILKDIYMCMKYCRSFFLLILIFFGASMFGARNSVFFIYVFLFSGMLPVTLMSYDERSHWMQYCGTLPYTKAQVVSGKYILGLFCLLVPILLSFIMFTVASVSGNGYTMDEMVMLLTTAIPLNLLSCSLCLPVVFKWGVEKGRIAYYFIIGAMTAVSFLIAGNGEVMSSLGGQMDPLVVELLFIAAALAVYGISWLVSIRFYQKREVA